MDLFHVNRGFIFPYHSLLAWAGKPCVKDRGLCALTSNVIPFSYGYVKTGMGSVIFPLLNMVLFKVGRNECIQSDVSFVCFYLISV